MNTLERINMIEKGADKILCLAQKMKESYNETDYERFVKIAEKELASISLVHLSQRMLLCHLYDALPSFPRNADEIEYNALKISVEKDNYYTFPVYKITLPYLIPNKRERKTILKSAIADIVNSAVRQFCITNSIVPFSKAHIIFVSSYEGETLNVDNDNKESVIIINGLIGKLIRDDRASVCNTTYCYQKSEKESKTEIYICDNADFVAVYHTIENSAQKD